MSTDNDRQERASEWRRILKTMGHSFPQAVVDRIRTELNILDRALQRSSQPNGNELTVARPQVIPSPTVLAERMLAAAQERNECPFPVREIVCGPKDIGIIILAI